MQAFKPSKQIILRTVLISIVLFILFFVFPIKSLELLCPANYLGIPLIPPDGPGSLSSIQPPPEYVNCVQKTVLGGLLLIIIVSYSISCASSMYLKRLK